MRRGFYCLRKYFAWQLNRPVLRARFDIKAALPEAIDVMLVDVPPRIQTSYATDLPSSVITSDPPVSNEIASVAS